MDEKTKQLLIAEREALRLEPIPQYGKYTHTGQQVYIDTEWGVARRKYTELRTQAIDEALAEPATKPMCGFEECDNEAWSTPMCRAHSESERLCALREHPIVRLARDLVETAIVCDDERIVVSRSSFRILERLISRFF